MMNEQRPASPERQEINDQQLFDEIRTQFTGELQKCVETYGPDWINRDVTRTIIEHLEAKQPVSFKDPFYGDIFDGILHDRGIRSNDESGKYKAIWSAIEEGK